MELMKTEYEFLDLSDVRDAELNSLQCALFQKKTQIITRNTNGPQVREIEPRSRSISTVSNNSESGGAAGPECDMSHSPARPPPYAQPPPPYNQPQWPVPPPNVYVSQVTANVNVHGYMGQYYQPQPTYNNERPLRPQRRERRNKRPPSPPQAPPYYVQYPQYYHPAAQAQGAPLYHMPVYQPVVYPYSYPPYYPEYSMPVEGGEEKVPDEYSQEVVMEQEAVEAYYAGAHYAPQYGPPEAVEYMPPVYIPPPQPMPPQPQHHHHTPHQFNVHAKNFVQGQHQMNKYIPQQNDNKMQEYKEYKPQQQHNQQINQINQNQSNIETNIKDLKLKGPPSPKTDNRDKVSPTPKDPKPQWVQNETKVPDVTINQTAPAMVKSFPPTASANQTTGVKIPPVMNKPGPKGAAAPFGNKQAPKPVPQAAVPIQQAVTTPKPPFANRQKREGTSNRSPTSENTDELRPSASIEHMKREPPLPPSKAPMPISITLHSQGGPPLIVSNKPPFGHSRKAVQVAPEPPPVPQPPPPAPTASDFPPPPTPRNRVEPPPAPAVQTQPQPAPGKSWASLFSSKSTITASVTPAPFPIEEPSSPTVVTPPVQAVKPVAKVPPFDASPSQAVVEKTSPTSKPVVTNVPTSKPVVTNAPTPTLKPVVTNATTPTSKPVVTNAATPTSKPVVTNVPTPTSKPVVPNAPISYSEKTSVNAVSNANTQTTPVVPKPVVAQLVPETTPVQKEPTPVPVPVTPSPFSDDPNSYRMGEFLSKYQLDNRAVPLLPRGLTNRSNYCYVNAILQALIACPPFYNMLKALPYQTRRGKSATPVIDSMVELCYEFSPITPGARSSRNSRAEGPAPGVPAGPPLEGGAGLKVLRALRPFPGSQEGRQEDAEEFLGCLLNSLNDEMLELMKLVEPDEPKEVPGAVQQNGIVPAPEPLPEEDDDDDEWKVMGPRNRGAVERRWAARRTPVADIFRGRTRVRLHKAAHHDVTDAVQPFFTLQLDIERSTTVKDALELLAGKDTLEGVSDAWQQLSLEQLPVVLLLHLKCFQLDSEGHTAKIVKSIDFPVDLKIDPKIMSSKLKYTQKQRLYKLFAVVYHEGVEAVKGHYLTDTFHGQVGWVRYDDSTVTQVTDAQVLKPKPPRMPYLLMYRRHDTLPVPHRPVGKPE